MGLAGGDEFLEGGPCARQESLVGFGQADTALRADEERGTNGASSARTAWLV
jgi:hypothetical protein